VRPQEPVAGSRRATGLPWNLTFAEALEQISVDDSSRSQVTSIDRERVPVNDGIQRPRTHAPTSAVLRRVNLCDSSSA